MKTLIAPSILSADFAIIGEEIRRMEASNADLIHCDVMDGIFVPNITFGPKFIADIRKITKLPLDVHLMIDRPERYIDRFMDAGADFLTIHYEATKVLRETLQQIKNRNVKCGVVISPGTPVLVLKGILKICDMVLLMSVHPGFGGQSFIEGSIDRLTELTMLAKAENPNILIEIDGGVTLENIASIKAAGAEVIVAGNTIFSASDAAAVISELRRR